MTYRSNRIWEPTPPFKAFLGVVAVALILYLLVGCSVLKQLANPQPSYDPRTVLAPHQTLLVNRSTGRLLKSPHLKLSDYRCQVPPMICHGSGVTMDCYCP